MPLWRRCPRWLLCGECEGGRTSVREYQDAAAIGLVGCTRSAVSTSYTGDEIIELHASHPQIPRPVNNVVLIRLVFGNTTCVVVEAGGLRCDGAKYCCLHWR